LEKEDKVGLGSIALHKGRLKPINGAKCLGDKLGQPQREMPGFGG